MRLGLLHNLRPLLPSRRRRAWRYVSPHRRGASLMAVALLLLVGYAYYHVTHDARIKRQVIAYLQQRTGGRVEVGRARFRLFEGVRIEGLRVFLPGDAQTPFLEAPRVILQHRPSSLVVGRKIEPTQIVCVRPVVRLIEDVKTGRLNVAGLYQRFRQGPGGVGGSERIPEVRIRDGELIRQDWEEGQLITIRRRRNVDVALLPDEQGRTLELKLEGPGGYHGSATMDLTTGSIEWAGQIDLAMLDDALPRKYRTWRQRYKVAGKATGAGSASVAETPGAATGPERFVVTLQGVSMEMPKEEGGLRFEEVHGELAFDSEGVEIRRLTGRIAGAGKATFQLRGRYRGYDTTSSFETDLQIDHLALPLPDRVAGVWGDSYAEMNRKLGLSGPVTVTAKVCRGGDGKLAVNGSAELDGVSAAPPELPTPLTDLTGRVTLNGQTVEFVNVQGRCGQAAVSVEGKIVDAHTAGDYDVRITARDLPFSREVYDALPEAHRQIWDELSPTGKADFRLHLRRDPDTGKASSLVTIDLKGAASILYKRFPYLVHNVAGEVVIDGGDVNIRSVTASNGPMACVVNGWLRRPGGVLTAEITVDVTAGSLDDRLMRALPRHVRDEYRACGLRGKANVTKAVFRYRRGTPLDYDIPVAITDATVCHDELPYRIDGATGTVRITPEALTIERLLGRRGGAKIAVDGRVLLSDEHRVDLNIHATSLAMDAELRKALPTVAQHWWDQFEPVGRADVSAALTRTLAGPAPATMPAATAPAAPAAAGEWDYRLRIRPRDMRIRYSGFPYGLKGVNGTVDVTAGRMRIESITALAGSAPVTISGLVTTRGDDATGDLAITSGPVAIDEQLLTAMGEELVSALRLKPGGTVSLNLSSLKVGADACPMPPTATAPAGGPEPATPWAWTGSIAFRDAIVEMGFGPKRVTGVVSGAMSCPPWRRYLYADGRLKLDSLTVGSRQLTDVTAVITKDPASAVLKVSGITGKVCGGRMAGFAEVSFAEPVKYGMNLSVEDVDLPTFLGAETDKRALTDVKGALSGTLQMMAVEDAPDSLRAKGRIQIVRGKLYKLPVMLGLLHLVYLTLPSDAAFQDADVTYIIRGDQMVFQEISLRGSALSMVGAGTLDLKTKKLDLTFVAGPPLKLPRIAGLSEVIEGLASALTTWRVTGTVAEPRIRQVPLHDLGATLRHLHEPGGR